jgi:hypothetical protein
LKLHTILFTFFIYFLFEDTGQVTKLGPRKSSSGNLTLPPSFRSPTWTTNRTVTSYSPSSTSPSSSPTLTRSANHTSHSSSSSHPTPSSGYNQQSNYNQSNNYESNADSSNGFTRAVRPASAGAAQQSTKTTEKEYIHNLQQQIQVLELQSKYLYLVHALFHLFLFSFFFFFFFFDVHYTGQGNNECRRGHRRYRSC